MGPRHLKTPASDLVLVRFTDFDDRGLARYRLWRKGASTVGPTIADFCAPGDLQVEQFVDAWYAGRRLIGNSITLAWQRTLASIEDEKKAAYHQALQSGDREAAREARREYLVAEGEVEFLKNAFFGKWPSHEVPVPIISGT